MDQDEFSVPKEDKTNKEELPNHKKAVLKSLPKSENSYDFENDDLPESEPIEVNWVRSGASSPVRTQKMCGSSWAFASMDAVESAFKIKGGELLDTSRQALVDCDKSNKGCDGGDPSKAINWLKDNGVYKESDYRYIVKQNSTCQKDKYKKIEGYNVLKYEYNENTSGNKEQQLAARVKKQPVIVDVNVSATWKSYSGGIIDVESQCDGKPNHSVVVYGYGTVKDSSGKDINYW